MPNLERIAANGLVFDNVWVNPMCSPTRATILTGLYGFRTGVLVAGDVLDPNTTTVWDYLRNESPAKYDMAVFGKHHLGGNGGETPDRTQPLQDGKHQGLFPVAAHGETTTRFLPAWSWT